MSPLESPQPAMGKTNEVEGESGLAGRLSDPTLDDRCTVIRSRHSSQYR